jgi:hypothetical protein
VLKYHGCGGITLETGFTFEGHCIAALLKPTIDPRKTRGTKIPKVKATRTKNVAGLTYFANVKMTSKQINDTVAEDSSAQSEKFTNAKTHIQITG